MHPTHALFRLALGGLLALTANAHAEGNPWTLGSVLTAAHDSNIRRAPDALAQSDNIVSLGARLKLDQPFGRERVVVDASLDHNRYNQYSELNNVSYSLNSRVEFEAGDRLYGTLGLDSSQFAFNYDPSTTGTFTGLNQERNSRLSLRVRLGVVTVITAEAAAEVQRRDESDSAFAYRELERQALEVGVRYQPSPDLALRALVRYAQGSYPGVGSGDKFRRTDLESTAAWQVTGASALDVRLTWSDETHDLSGVRDTSQWSGAARWRWQPTGKLSFSLRAARDSDTGASDLNLLGATLTNSDARQRTSLDLGGNWAISGKLRLDAALSYSHRSLDSRLQALSTQAGSDRTRIARIGLVYQPLRSLETGCNVSREQRDTSGDTGNLTYAYAATAFSCYVQALLN